MLLADPRMTGESRYSIGDKRRPHDVTLLTPILAHWGLAMTFDEDQPDGYRTEQAGGGPVPVNLPGQLSVMAGSSQCRVSGGGVLALCVLGRGRATVVADAAVLDSQAPREPAVTALVRLAAQAFP